MAIYAVEHDGSTRNTRYLVDSYDEILFLGNHTVGNSADDIEDAKVFYDVSLNQNLYYSLKEVQNGQAIHPLIFLQNYRQIIEKSGASINYEQVGVALFSKFLSAFLSFLQSNDIIKNGESIYKIAATVPFSNIAECYIKKEPDKLKEAIGDVHGRSDDDLEALVQEWRIDIQSHYKELFLDYYGITVDQAVEMTGDNTLSGGITEQIYPTVARMADFARQTGRRDVNLPVMLLDYKFEDYLPTLDALIKKEIVNHNTQPTLQKYAELLKNKVRDIFVRFDPQLVERLLQRYVVNLADNLKTNVEVKLLMQAPELMAQGLISQTITGQSDQQIVDTVESKVTNVARRQAREVLIEKVMDFKSQLTEAQFDSISSVMQAKNSLAAFGIETTDKTQMLEMAINRKISDAEFKNILRNIGVSIDQEIDTNKDEKFYINEFVNAVMNMDALTHASQMKRLPAYLEMQASLILQDRGMIDELSAMNSSSRVRSMLKSIHDNLEKVVDVELYAQLLKDEYPQQDYRKIIMQVSDRVSTSLVAQLEDGILTNIDRDLKRQLGER